MCIQTFLKLKPIDKNLNMLCQCYVYDLFFTYSGLLGESS